MTNPEFSSNRAGDFAEYYAVTWLWDSGYQVFKNCGCDGPVDLIAMDKDGSIILIDVKTMRRNFRTKTKNYDYKGQLTDYQKELGVVVLAFHPDTRECYFVGHKHEKTNTGHRDEHFPQYDLGLCDSGH